MPITYQTRTPDAADAPPAAPVAATGCPATGLEARLEGLGVPADVLAEVRKVVRENGAGIVDPLIQKRVLPEA